MRNFKKAFLVSIAFFLAITSGSFFLTYMLFNNEGEYYLDKNVRDELAGQLDTLIIGSSNGMCAFDCSVLDKELGCCSYNLCGSMISPSGKIALIEEELTRNKIDRVLVEVSFEDMTIDFNEVNAEGEINLIPRLNGTKKQISYFFDNVSLKDYPSIYGMYINRGLKTFVYKLTGKYESLVDSSLKGQRKKASVDMSISNGSEATKRDSIAIGSDVLEINKTKLKELIALCRNYGADVYLVSVPFTDAFVWERIGLDFYHLFYSELATETQCKYYDFNLLKSKSDFLSDKISFSDHEHLSENGAEKFSSMLSEILNKEKAGMNTDMLFFPTYEEVSSFSPYNWK